MKLKFGKILIFILLIGLIALPSVPALAANNLVYHCWQFNVDGAGGKCTSPSLIFNSNGTYTLGSESGTYGIRKGKIILSGSTFRGLGELKENGFQLFFDYHYNGKHHNVTYLLRPGAVR